MWYELFSSNSGASREFRVQVDRAAGLRGPQDIWPQPRLPQEQTRKEKTEAVETLHAEIDQLGWARRDIVM